MFLHDDKNLSICTMMNKPIILQQESPEPFFTIVRRNGEKKNNEPGPPWCTRHELRHSIPWSLREPTSVTRANTTLNDSGESVRIDGACKSADAKKRDMDEWRLKILLEELYKDKKYFDHVLDSTGEAYRKKS